MGHQQQFDIEEWEAMLGKLLRFHDNISLEIGVIIQTIRKEMKQDLVPVAEEKATFGKEVKKAIRSLWALEYEIEDIQREFAKGIGQIDINNLTDDFVEDVMLQSKPLQGILLSIRRKQEVRMDELKKLYWDQIKDLAPLNIARPIRSVSALDAKNKEVKPETPGPAVAVDPPALPAEVAA